MQVILVVSDTLRADHLGCHGYFRPTSPRIDAFASQECASAITSARPLHPALVYQPGHRAVRHHPQGAGQPLRPESQLPVAVDDHTPVLADLFRAAGEPVRIEHGRYVGGGTLTASFDNLANFPNHPRWFVRGYEYHVAVIPGTQRMVGAEVLHRRLFPWLEQHAGESFFLFVHYWDVHGPYLAPPLRRGLPRTAGGEAIPVPLRRGADYVRGWGPVEEITPEARARIDAYDGGIAYFDAMFGNLLDHLDALGIGRQAVVPSPPTTGRAWPSTASPSPTTPSTTPRCTCP